MPVHPLSYHCQIRRSSHLTLPLPSLPLIHLLASPMSHPLRTYHTQSLRSPSHVWLMTLPSITSSEDCSKALLHPSCWCVIPSSNLGLHSEFRLCLQYWLGLHLSSDTVSCPVCSRPSDPFGDYSLACGGNNDRILRHNAIGDIILTTAQSADLSPHQEVSSLIPGSLSRPAEIYVLTGPGVDQLPWMSPSSPLSNSKL